LKNIQHALIAAVSMFMLALSPLGCSESETTEPANEGADALDTMDGGDSEDVGDFGDSEEVASTPLEEAAEAACNWAADCAEEEGAFFDREELCDSYDLFREFAVDVGDSCETAVMDYLECVSDSLCYDSNPCPNEQYLASFACR
jgi:hypothetical protein